MLNVNILLYIAPILRLFLRLDLILHLLPHDSLSDIFYNTP